MNKNGNGQDHDFIADGFLPLDPKHAKAKPIKWGAGYLNRSDEEKIRYLEKLASSLNHALELIQGERNHWGQVAEKKEGQVIELSRRLTQNNEILQSEITKMNAYRQSMTEEVKKLRAELKAKETP